MAGEDDQNINNQPPNLPPPTRQAPHTVSTIKLPILKKGEYDIWAMKMEHYLAHTDYPVWEVIQNGNGPLSISIDTQGQIKILPPKSAEEILARERERKARTTLLMALPEDHLARFHNISDAKEMWDAIKTRFGGNAENTGNKDKKNRRRTGKQEDSKAMVTIYGEGVDWTTHSEDEQEDYALMACNNSSSDTEVQSCSNECVASYNKLKKLYDEQRTQLSQLWYEEKIRFMKIDLDDKTDVLTYHKKLLAEAQKEKEDLKAKVEKWHNSSKNIDKLLNTQMSANDKFRLRYGDHKYDGILSYENEVLQSVFMNKESELEKQPLYDRFVTAGGMHAVPPPMTGNYIPFGPDIKVDYSQFTYGPKQTQPSESESQTSEFDTYSEDEYVSIPTKEQETPSFAYQNKNPRVDKKGLVYGFTARACFVCGSLSHLIRDCDFHEKRMAKQAELNNSMRMKSSQREIRPIWNNVQRVNNKNQFVPTAVLTRTGKIPVNTARASGTNKVSTARHDFNRQAVLTSAAMKVNTVKPIVNRVRPTTVFHKTHSPFSRPFNNTTTLRTNFSKQKVNTAKVNAVSAVGGKRETAVKPSAGCNWRPQRHHNWHNDYPHRALQNKGIVDSGCSRHMTGNKAYLAEYQDFNGGPVAFGGSKGYITGKVLLRIPRQNNMYSFNLENIVPSGGLACLIGKATIDESNKWHRRFFKMTTLVLLVKKESDGPDKLNGSLQPIKDDS
ncbi:hypothetical protein Tco_1137034, partial [Tanacetum coccineum]